MISGATKQDTPDPTGRSGNSAPSTRHTTDSSTEMQGSQVSIVQKLIGMGLRPRVRKKARGRSLEELARRLEASREQLMPRILAARDTPGNREALNHFIGIERWSLSRVRIARGAVFQLDSYRGYRPPELSTLSELQVGFRDAREETIALARELDSAGVDPHISVRHNDLGELSILEWFAYIDDHSRREIIRIRT
jgi:hypothetical protein